MLKKLAIVAIALSSLGLGPAVATANAQGVIIRIGNDCYFNAGIAGLIRIACPREVSTE